MILFYVFILFLKNVKLSFKILRIHENNLKMNDNFLCIYKIVKCYCYILIFSFVFPINVFARGDYVRGTNMH